MTWSAHRHRRARSLEPSQTTPARGDSARRSVSTLWRGRCPHVTFLLHDRPEAAGLATTEGCLKSCQRQGKDSAVGPTPEFAKWVVGTESRPCLWPASSAAPAGRATGAVFGCDVDSGDVWGSAIGAALSCVEERSSAVRSFLPLYFPCFTCFVYEADPMASCLCAC